MTNSPRRRRAGLACWAVALSALAAGNAGATATAIYKCVDRNLGIVYTDVPCKDGERLDLRPGDADPAAIARLDRERDALDRSAAQRIIDERRATLQRRYYGNGGPAYPVQEGFAYPEAPDYYPYGYGLGYAYPYDGVATPERRRHSDLRHDRRSQHSRAVPAQPRLPGR